MIKLWRLLRYLNKFQKTSTSSYQLWKDEIVGMNEFIVYLAIQKRFCRLFITRIDYLWHWYINKQVEQSTKRNERARKQFSRIEDIIKFGQVRGYIKIANNGIDTVLVITPQGKHFCKHFTLLLESLYQEIGGINGIIFGVITGICIGWILALTTQQ